MSNTRTPTSEENLTEYLIDPQIPKAFLDEYIDYRTRTVWNKPLGFFTGYFRDDQPNRTAECNDLKKRFGSAKSGEALAEMIIKAGELARKAQAESTDQSSYAQALHATRTYYITKTLDSPYKEEYLAEIEKTREALINVEEDIHITNCKQLDVKNLQIKRKEIFQKLIEMHDPQSLEEAVRTSFFSETLLPTKEQLATLAKFPNFEINPNIPLTYQDQYYLIHLILVLKTDYKREHYFTSLLKRNETASLPHYEQPLDEILDYLSVDPANEATSQINSLVNKEMQLIKTATVAVGENEGEKEVADPSVNMPNRNPVSLAQKNLFTLASGQINPEASATAEQKQGGEGPSSPRATTS